MSSSNINSVFAVLSVRNQDDAVRWYANLLGRNADMIPVEGVAEWQLTDSAWLQVTADSERAGSSTVIVGVNDIEAQCRTCADASVPHGEVVEYPGIIKMIEVIDPDGNKIAFVQDISSAS